MPKKPDIIGVAEASRLLGIDRSVLTRRVQAGRIPYLMKFAGVRGAYVFDRKTIEQMADTK